MDSDIVLYQYPGPGKLPSFSPPCVKIQLALNILGLDFEVKNLGSSMEAKKASPSGRVPALKYRGEVLTESLTIMDRLQKDHGNHPLFQGDWATSRVWETFAGDHLYWMGFFFRWAHPVYHPRFFNAVFSRMSFFTRVLVRLFFLPDMRKRALAQGIGRQPPAEVEALMLRATDTLAAALGDKPFLNGDHPGRGDLGLAATLVQVGFLDTMEPVHNYIKDSHPQLLEYTARVFTACKMPLVPWLKKD